MRRTKVFIGEQLLTVAGIHLGNMCKEKKGPFFFHFDEVGRFDGRNLRKLRDECQLFLRLLGAAELQTSFPFFYFSGQTY